MTARLLLAFGTIAVARVGQKERSWPRNPRESGECWITLFQLVEARVARGNRGFLGDLNEAFKRSIDPSYRGPKRGFIDGLSLGLAEIALGGSATTQTANEFITRELQRLGYQWDIASAVTQALASSIGKNDYSDVVARLERAGEQGSDSARVTLGALYLYGKGGLPQSVEKAVDLFSRAANAGDATAQYNMGVLYWHGQGVSQSRSKAVEYFIKAANQNDAPAQLVMGTLHYHGEVVEKSHPQAAHFFSKAAEQGIGTRSSI